MAHGCVRQIITGVNSIKIKEQIKQTKKGASQVALLVKNPLANTGDIRDLGSIPGLGRSPRGGHGNPLQYSSLENPMDTRT